MNLQSLVTEQVNAATERIERMGTVEMLEVMNREDAKVAEAVGRQLPAIARAIDGVVEVIRRGGHLYYIGAGTSGRLGVLDASECPPTYNVPAETIQGVIAGGEKALSRSTEASEDDPESGMRDLLERGFTGTDAVCGIAASGRTPYVVGAVTRARQLGALTIGISCVPDAALSRAVSIPIEIVTGPEVVAGSTRMKAGTATKMALNMISTGAMIRLGYTYGNLMVNVQPTNEKLAERARRIIAVAGKVSAAESSELLESSGRSVRTAIVMGRLKIDREEAERRLRDASNVVARALGEI